MGRVIGALLPLAIGIAISPTMIIATVLMLLSPSPKGRAVGLLVGCVVGVGGSIVLFAVLSGLLPRNWGGVPSPTAGVIKLGVGAGLLVLSVSQWRRRPARGGRTELPKWTAGVGSTTPAKAFLLGLLLSAVVPKNMLIAFSAGVVLGEATLSAGQATVVILLFTAIASSAVAIPVVGSLATSGRMSGPLEDLRAWLVDESATIMVVVLLVIGVSMIGKGLASL